MNRRAVTARLLVFVQFALIVWIVWPCAGQAWTPPALALLACSIALGIWTLTHNRPGNFNIRPEPKASGRLVTNGPYRWVRHPMYGALLLFAAAEVIACDDTWKVAGWCALAVVLYAKSVVEERGLREKYADYARYSQRVRRFIPGLF
jgi:protein-S-isoprenylcysteine O-methyltransferase Ste14